MESIPGRDGWALIMVSATPVSWEPPTVGRQPFAAAGTAARGLSAWGCRPTFDGRKDDQRRRTIAHSRTIDDIIPNQARRISALPERSVRWFKGTLKNSRCPRGAGTDRYFHAPERWKMKAPGNRVFRAPAWKIRWRGFFKVPSRGRTLPDGNRSCPCPRSPGASARRGL